MDRTGDEGATARELSYRMECRYKGAGLTHYIPQSDDAPF